MKNIFSAALPPVKALILFFLVAFSTALHAQASLSVQGVLTKSDGTAVDDGTYTVNFRLYDQPTGGNQVHAEPIDVETIGGVYSVVLGQNAAYPMTASFGTIYYLSVMIGSSELLPRPQLTHSPYALSLLGQSNKFPSSGLVNADAITVGGAATIQGSGTVNGGLTVSGGQTISGASTIQNGQTVNGGQTINGGQTVNNNQTVNGNSTVTGISVTNGKVLTKSLASGGGYSFDNDGNYDSGLFGIADGEIMLRANNASRILIGSNGINYHSSPTIFQNNTTVEGQFTVYNLPDFDGKNMQWNATTGRVGADNSTRRAKYNITDLNDDFSLILQARPRTYTRKVDPNRWEIGYIAEEMDSLGLKKLVEYDAEGRPDGYNYEKMIIYVTEIVKVQHHDIHGLQQEVAALKAENTALRAQNAGLTTSNNQQQSDFNARLEALSKRMNALETGRADHERK